jgi:hypothetical protein
MELRRLILTFTIVSCCALASPIATLHNTGTVITGSGPVVDTAWKIGGNTAFVTESSSTGFPFNAWFANSATSQWISPQNVYPSEPGDAASTFAYTTEFYLTGLDLATATITGKWAADNTPVDLLLNGVSVNFVFGPDIYSAFSGNEFTITSGFNPGKNTLQFLIHNMEWPGINPTGLRVEFESNAEERDSPVPEPASYVLLASALLGLSAVRRRQR